MAANDMTSPTESMEMAGNENSGFEDHDDGACTTKMVDMGAFTIYVNDEDDNNTLPQSKQKQQQQQKTEVTSSISNSTSVEMRNQVSGEEADDHESKSKSSDGGIKEERSGCGVGDNMGVTSSNNVTDNQNEQQKEGGVVVEVKEEGEGQGDVQEKTAITRVVLPYRSMRDINRILTKRMTGSVDVSINRINQTLACSTR